MNSEEIYELVNEITSNTLDFLKHEFALQLKNKNLSLERNLTILTHVIIQLVVNHVMNLANACEKNPIYFLRSMKLEENIKDAMENLGESQNEP